MSDLKDQLNEKIATKVFRSYKITSPRNELKLKPPQKLYNKLHSERIFCLQIWTYTYDTGHTIQFNLDSS